MKGIARPTDLVETSTTSIIKDVYAKGGLKGFY
jgi:hypothetical protein